MPAKLRKPPRDQLRDWRKIAATEFAGCCGLPVQTADISLLLHSQLHS